MNRSNIHRGLYLGIDYPKQVIAVLLVLTLVVAIGILWVRADTSTDSFIPRGDISYENKQEIEARFGIDDPLLINVRGRNGEDVFTVAGLELVRQLTDYVGNIKGVNRATLRSVATRENVVGTPEGLEIRDFLQSLPQTDGQAQRIKAEILDFPLYAGLIISKDGKSAGIVADVNDDADILAIFHDLKSYVDANFKDSAYEIGLSGPPIVTGTLNVYLNQDALTLDPLAAVATSLLLFFIFRTVHGVVLPLAVMLPAVVWCLGFMGLLGYRFTPFSNAIPVVILAAALADSVHIIGDYYDSWHEAQSRGETPDKATILKSVLDRMWRPVVLTSLTTAIGFFMLTYMSPMIPVQEFGVIITIGVLVAMLFSLYFLSAILMLTKLSVADGYRQRLSVSAAGGKGLIAGLLGATYRLLTGRPVLVLLVCSIITVVGAIGVSKLYYDYDAVSLFPGDSAVVRDNTVVRADYVGTNFIEVQVDSGNPEGVFEPGFLQAVDAFQAAVEDTGSVGNTISIVDYLKKMNKEYNAGDEKYYTLADTARKNQQFFFLFQISGNPVTFNEVVDNDERYVNVRLFLREGSYAKNRDFIAWLEQNAGKYLGSFAYKIGGESYVTYRWMQNVGGSVIYSILFMTAVMALLGYWSVRSWKAALLMTLPVNAGIFMTYAMMGYTGIGVGLGSSVFASIAIGVGIDFAIHFVMRYHQEFACSGEYRQSLHDTLMGAGRLIFFNACIVVLGFSVLILAKTSPPAQIGMYVAVTVSISLLMTYFVLGYLLRFVWRESRPEGILETQAIESGV